MSLIEELSKQEHWDETMDRMTKKSNLNNEQSMEVILLNSCGFKEQFIEHVISGTYAWSIPRKILLNKIGTTKKRTVYMYSIQDRYVLGVLYRVFSKQFNDTISSNCFSYKRGVKTLNAIDYLRSDTQLNKKHGVKLDIKAYFNSVNRECLNRILAEISLGDTGILKLLTDMFNSDIVTFEDKEIVEYKSLTPGSALASFLANYCLKDIDNYVVDTLGITYARYSDDILMFADTKEELQKGLDMVNAKLDQLGLLINDSKYVWFEPGAEVDFLGLKLKADGKIDISDNSAKKFKKKIRHSCIMGRHDIEYAHKDPYKVAKKIIGRYNYRVYKCFIQDASKFGWAYYAFRYINIIDTIKNIDYYMKDRLRQMITGHNNSANIRKVSDLQLAELGYVSMVDMYIRFKSDFDYYCDTVDLLEG